MQQLQGIRQEYYCYYSINPVLLVSYFVVAAKMYAFKINYKFKWYFQFI